MKNGKKNKKKKEELKFARNILMIYPIISLDFFVFPSLVLGGWRETAKKKISTPPSFFQPLPKSI
jgi:hypothetical protein